ncbi:hypothetical protein BDF19DRAFT_432647 [Syncephalis fuscata]|nr:hypothetical protein BDF19DRAFT_432647 [Syncephalis fuscata]
MSDEEEAPSSRLPWGLTKEGVKPGTIKQIAAKKMQTFKIGVQKKTPFQKRKEEEELKRRKAEEEAAEVYKEFVASFEDDEPGMKAFVRAGTMGSSDKSSDTKAESRSAYRPQPFVKAGQKSTSTISTPQQLNNTVTKSNRPTTTTTIRKPVKSTNATSCTPKAPKRPVITTPGQRHNPFAEDEDDSSDDESAKLKANEANEKKRNLDTFMQNLKRDHETHEKRLQQKRQAIGDYDGARPSFTVQAAFEDKQGSHDLGDPTTTNIFVSNIPNGADELLLCKHFGRYGPIGSVKIMWPRPYDERSGKGSSRLSGFVAFMYREHAAQALKNLDGSILLNNQLRCVWGKAVPLPSKPFYVPSASSGANSTSRSFSSRLSDDSMSSSRHKEIVVEQPTNREVLYIIHRTVERITRYGPQFEATIIDREQDNPKFRFLYDHRSPDHTYYRWRLFTTLNGDNTSQWREELLEMFDDDIIWIPPEIHSHFEDDDDDDDDDGSDTEHRHRTAYNSDVEYEREREELPKGQLGPIAKRRLNKMIRIYSEGEYGNLEIRERIGEFALDHTDDTKSVVDIVIQSLLLKDIPYPVKVIRFELISELLVRSGQPAPGAWKIRSSFEARLPELFTHLGQVSSSIGSRLKAENYKRQIFDHFRLWEGQSLFTHEQLNRLADCFDGIDRTADSTPIVEVQTEPVQPVKRAGFRPIGSVVSDTSANEPAPTPKLIESTEDSIDGEPLMDTTINDTNEDDLNGEPMELNDIANGILDNKDEEAEEDEDDLDGQPLAIEEEEEEEELDGQPMEESIFDMPAELVDKLERYRASLSVQPQMNEIKMKQLLIEFRDKLLQSIKMTPLPSTLESYSAVSHPSSSSPSVILDTTVVVKEKAITITENGEVKNTSNSNNNNSNNDNDDDFDMFAA